MKVVSYLIKKFFQEEKINIITLVILSLVLTIFQTNGISFLTAKIIEMGQNGKHSIMITHFKLFVVVSLLYIGLYYVYKKIQNGLMVKLIQWVKNEIFILILKLNNVGARNINFAEFFTPITRISSSLYILFTNVVASFIPGCAFLIGITGYFLYKTPLLGLIFLLGNVIVGIYYSLNWKSMFDEKDKHEIVTNQNEFYMLDVLNNIDKVFYRGQTNLEMGILTEKTDNAIQVTNNYINNITVHSMRMNIIVYITLFICGWYLIKLKINKKIDTTTFITFFTILLLYRDRMLGLVNEIPEYVEFIGRLEFMNDKFNNMIGEAKNVDEILEKIYEPKKLEFDRVRFENVSFHYETAETMILSNFNIELDLDDQVIGIVGLSGKGKSTFAKLILRLYEPTNGAVYIDDINIKEIDPNYIRENVTYVNQNSKLFNTKIIENIYYGCSNPDKCDVHLKEILKYDKIQQLFKNLDIHEDEAGHLGEKLSGGQRQIVNIIGGLINPSKILILDEPTNALDKELKTQLLLILKDFKKYKKSLIIITHDKDVYPLFDKTITL
jgi:ABC-type bacteriocin/lantibiotic exporter with double-glycine peptidase domain